MFSAFSILFSHNHSIIISIHAGYNPFQFSSSFWRQFLPGLWGLGIWGTGHRALSFPPFTSIIWASSGPFTGPGPGRQAILYNPFISFFLYFDSRNRCSRLRRVFWPDHLAVGSSITARRMRYDRVQSIINLLIFWAGARPTALAGGIWASPAGARAGVSG